MLILILETSSEKGLLVLANQEIPIRSKELIGGPELSQTLSLEVKKILQESKPDLVAVGVGPGSYTGIRVAAALGKALAYGWNIPLLGFCSLKAFGSPPVLVCARSQGFYALLDQKAELISPKDPRLEELFLEKKGIIRSPHPEKIKKKLPFASFVLETSPSAPLLARLVSRQFLEEGSSPLTLNYLTHP